MIPEIIIDQQTDAHYAIERDPNGRVIELGSGATAVVYRARLESRGSKNHPEIASQVAVKVAHSNLLASTLQDFRAEQEKIARLRERTDSVPWAHLGKDPSRPELDVILLELVNPEVRLPKIAKGQKDERLPEEIALETGCQYAELLIALHEGAGLTMRGDRKEGDAHWDGRRLVVLDWNRAQSLPKDENERAASIRQDIRIFGHLWAQSMLGRAVQLLEPDDVSDEAWGCLTLGTRLIFAKAFGCSEGEYADSTHLKDDLCLHLKRFRMAQSKPAALLTEAQGIEKQIGTGATTFERITQAREIQILADLVLRSTASTKSQKEKAQELEQKARKSFEDERTKVGKIIEELQSDLSLQQYDRAVNRAKKALDDINGDSHAELLVRLTIRRWFIVATIAVSGKNNGIAMQNSVNTISVALRQLEKSTVAYVDLGEQLGATQQAKRDIESAVPTAIQNTARLLILELAIRVDTLNGMSAEKENRGEDAHEDFARALTNWKELNRNDKDYAHELRERLPHLSQAIVEDTAGQANEWIADVESFIKQANTVFDAILRAEHEFPDVDQSIQVALRFYRERLAGWDGGRFAITTEEDLRLRITGNAGPGEATIVGDVGLLQQISRLNDEMRVDLSDRNEDSVLKHLHALTVLSERTGVKEALVRFATTSALEHIQHLMDNGRWPDELALTKRLVDEAGAANFELQIKAAQYFTAWENASKRLRPSDLSPYTLDDFRAKNLDDPKDPALPDYDAILREAEQFNDGKGIELFERIGLSNEEINQRRVSVLRHLREARRVSNQINTLAQSLGKLSEEMVQHQKTLDTRLEQVQSARKQVEEAVTHYRSNVTAQEAKLEKQTPQIERIVGEFKQVAEQLGSLYTEQLPDSEEIASNVQQKIGAWQGFARDTQDAVEKVNQAFGKLVDHPDIEPAREDARRALPALYEIIQAIYITAGLEAVRDLRVNRAREYLDRAKAVVGKPESTISNQMSPERTPLENAVQWLEENTPAWEQLRAWKTALDDTELNKAEFNVTEKARTTFTSATSSQDVPTYL